MTNIFSRRPVIQSEHSECGLASCAFLLNVLGKECLLGDLRTRFGVPRGGLTFNNMQTILSSFSVYTRGVRILSLREDHVKLRKYVPFIAHWGNDHYVVVTQLSRKSIRIMDPAKGYERIPILVADTQMDGNLLLVSQTNYKSHYKSRQGTDKSTSKSLLFSLLNSSKAQMTFAVLLLLVGKLVSLIPPEVIKRLMNTPFENTVNNESFMALLFYIMFVFLIAFVSAIVSSRLSIKWSRTLNVAFVDTLLGKQLAFFINRSQGSLLYKLNLIGAIQNLLMNISVSSAVDYLSLLIYLAFLYYLSPSLTIIVIIFTLLLTCSSAVYSKVISRLNRRTIESQAKAQSVISEAIASPETIKSNKLEKYILSRWRELFENNLAAGYKLTKLSGAFQSILSSVVICLPLMTILVALKISSSSHNLTAGDLFAYVTVLGYLSAPLTTMGSNVLQFGTLASDLDQVEDVFELEKPVCHEYAGFLPGESKSVNVEVQNISFRFSQFDEAVLNSCKLNIPAGSKIAIVGISGSGKSTLLRILANLIEPTKGKIIYNATDSGNSINPSEAISFVPQDSYLFGDSLAENLGLQNSVSIDSDIFNSVFRCCGLDSIASQHANLETVRLSEGGKNLSGGQKQRISVARALLRNMPVIMLDEPTSSLDASSEDAITDYLKSISSTVILVSHRLSSVLKMDEVIVLDNGCVVEQGEPNSLLSAHGAFHKIFSPQMI